MPRLLATALAVVGVLAAGPAEANPASRLDGRKTRSLDYGGRLTSPMYPVFPNVPNYTAPSPDHCVPGSCDKRMLRLTLPRGTSWGKFRATVSVPAELQAAVFLYDSRNQLKRSDELAMRPLRDRPIPCCDEGRYTLEVSHPMLPSGTYLLMLVDRVGSGRFDAHVEWTAHPPDRPV